jgi:thymidine kinase
MVTEGEVIVVGDTKAADDEPVAALDVEMPLVGYEVLCRQHHRRKLTAARAKAVSMVPDPLPFD